ncbi:MAG: GNAT family N-acetyltransferase [Anaerolineae bacterium]|nr:GNAT family N-acetyltransferase [Anaerolineae bacterium]
MLGICFQLNRHPDWIKTRPYFITISTETELVLAAVQTPPYNLVIYGRRHDCDRAFALLAQNLWADQQMLPGVLGPAPIAETFAQSWANIAGTKYRAGMRQRIYELKSVVPPPSTPGHMRLARAGDANLITQWALAFQTEALTPGHPTQTRAAIEQRIGDQEIYLWQDARPVSMAAKARPVSNGIAVSLVYTPPEFRRQGYATACVAALSQLLLDSGRQYCSLFTDLSNPTSNHIYRKIGYTPVCDFNEYIFDAAANT